MSDDIKKASIKKIDFIKNMAVFKNFRWDTSVRDDGNNVDEFKKINILYGRNYSGKTTLSRIFRALEMDLPLSKKYDSPEFQLSFDDGSTVTQDSLKGHHQIVRVFNEDFVKENLRFLANDEENINSFAILGKDNTRIEEEMKKHEAELGSKEDRTGLRGKLLYAEKEFNNAKKLYTDKLSELDLKLLNKANNRSTGIKYNKSFGDPNYNIHRIKKDIATVRRDSYAPITDEQTREYYNLLEDKTKTEILKFASVNLQYTTIAAEAQELIEKKIEWKNSLKNPRAHVNKESEKLRIDLDNLLILIEQEQERIPKPLKIKIPDFYSKFTANLYQVVIRLSALVNIYNSRLKYIKTQVEERKGNIPTHLSFVEPASIEDDLTGSQNLKELRDELDRYIALLNAEQSEIRKSLRLHEIHRFITDIDYEDELIDIAWLQGKMGEAEGLKTTAKNNVDTKQTEINETESQLKDESNGADRINEYLNNFFGHRSLSLKIIKEKSGGKPSGYRFEVTRNGKKAFHLSEGECSLIAFCYFIAKLDDTDTNSTQPIIWIDDPVSSLDSNHIFFVYSLINTKIATPEKYEDGKEQDRFKQLFISTHNLDFLKYLQWLPGVSKKKSHFIIAQTNDQTSEISVMPQYMKEHATEFNFLFHQIYKCAKSKTEYDENHNCYYNFGNNARKFLETYLYYRYPDNMTHDGKMARFFKGDVEKSLINRITNEFSHMNVNTIEQGSDPGKVAEIKEAAEFILRKMEEKDLDQYKALLKSIEPEEDQVNPPHS